MSRLVCRVEEGSLRIGSDVSNTAELQLTIAAAIARAEGVPGVELAWDLYGDIASVMDGPPRTGWVVTNYAAGRAGVFGVAIQTSGDLASATHAIYAKTMTRLRRFWCWGGTFLTGHPLPVLPTTTLFTACSAERATLAALVRVLTARPELRQRLDEPASMERLARDLTDRVLPPVQERTGATRDAVDIVQAMHAAGFVHRFGRPLAAGEIAPLGEVIEATIRQLERNPYRAGRPTDTAVVERVVRRNYADVEPWPFAALVAAA